MSLKDFYTSEEYLLTNHIMDFFKENVEFFNKAESEKKVFKTVPFATNNDGTSKRNSHGIIATETIELPVMENPKHFFRFCAHKRLEELFERAPESFEKLGTRPWKYILKYSPEFANICPYWKEFSEEEKSVFLKTRPELIKYCI